MNKQLTWLCLLALAGCTEPATDGKTAADYYAKNPFASAVGQKVALANIVFAPSAAELDDAQRETLKKALMEVSRSSVEQVTVEYGGALTAAMKAAVTRELAVLGFVPPVQYTAREDMARGSATISVAYAAALVPDCGDWSKSPISNYGNTHHPNMGCATAKNLGLMLEDPRDLERGASAGYVPPHPDRAADAVVHYRASNAEGSTGSPVQGVTSANTQATGTGQ